MGAPENYYDAPKEGPALPVPRELPTTFPGKFSLALELYFSNFLTIAAAVLTVWLPLNFLTDVLLTGGSQSADPLSVLFGTLVEVIFGPIVAGAVIWIVRQRIAGNPARYGEAMRAGFRSWGAIFAARFVASLFVLVGLIALIVPGIRFMIYYALIDQVAAVENPGYSRSLSRSKALVNGQFWQIALVIVLTLSLGLLVVVVTSILEAYDPFGFFNTPVGDLVGACSVDILTEIPTCLFTVYYLESAARESRYEMRRETDPSVMPQTIEPSGNA
jgi:hypothetical protein